MEMGEIGTAPFFKGKTVLGRERAVFNFGFFEGQGDQINPRAKAQRKKGNHEVDPKSRTIFS